MPHVDIAGHATYFEQHGAGDPLLLLHGGFCSIETWQPQIEHLALSFRVHAPERPGQGRTADRDGPITYEAMVRDTVGYLDAMDVAQAHVVGFSDGAITGLMLAMDHPQRVRSLVSISANLDPQGLVDDSDEGGGDDGEDGGAADEDLDPFREAYDRLSPDGPAHREVVLDKLVRLWQSEPHIEATELARITAPTLVLAGDRDSIRTEHTVEIARAIPGARLCIVPGAGHLVTLQRPAVVNLLVEQFLLDTSVAQPSVVPLSG